MTERQRPAAAAEHARKLAALDAFFSSYEAEYGEITAEEMDAATRRMRDRAVRTR